MSRQNYSSEPICMQLAQHTFHRLGMMSDKTERNASKTVDFIEDIFGTFFFPDTRYKAFISRLLILLKFYISFRASAAPFFTAPAPNKIFQRLRLRLREKCVDSRSSGSGSTSLIYTIFLGCPLPLVTQFFVGNTDHVSMGTFNTGGRSENHTVWRGGGGI